MVLKSAIANRLANLCRMGMEALLLIMVAGSPWAFGAADAWFEFLLDVGIMLLLSLWGLRMLVEGQVNWQNSPIAACLAGLFLLGILQSMPLPPMALAWLSPATARLYGQLLPTPAEEMPPSDDSNLGNHRPPGSTISLYPAATRNHALRLLRIFLIFAVVSNNLVSISSMRRLCYVCVVNGSALAMFAIVQFLTSPTNMLYWRFTSLGSVFGPFICRNHFPYYLNVCIGLGVGLVLSRGTTARHPAAGAYASAFDLTRPLRSWKIAVSQLLHDSVSLWICMALVLMLSSVMLSLSRGGVLALLAGLLFCLLTKVWTSPHRLRWGSMVLVGGCVMALVCWVGFARIHARFGALWRDAAVEEGRLSVWLRVLPLAAEFPLWGTGYATLQFVEPLRRTSAVAGDITWDHAHNDYVEMLVEGGGVGLGLGLLLIGLVYARGMRAVRRQDLGPSNNLALGALAAFTAVVVHSIGDFGLHIPANALLASVLCAYLSALGHGGRNGPESLYRWRAWGLAPFLGAMSCLGLGVLICAAGWQAYRVDRLKAVADLLDVADHTAARRRVQLLTRAQSLDQDNAELLFALADAQFHEYENTNESQANMLLLAVENYVRARDACPLLPRAHLAIALYHDKLPSADSMGAYLERAKFLAPGDADLWYQCGRLELSTNQAAAAWASWRRCLELSDARLPEIVGKASTVISAEALIQHLLPARSEILLTAATRLFPQADDFDKRQPFLRRSLELFDAKRDPLSGPDLRLKAHVFISLGKIPKAIETYQALLAENPEAHTWRLEFARFLFAQRRLAEARGQLLILLAEQPQHAPAREFLAIVQREILRPN